MPKDIGRDRREIRVLARAFREPHVLEKPEPPRHLAASRRIVHPALRATDHRVELGGKEILAVFVEEGALRVAQALARWFRADRLVRRDQLPAGITSLDEPVGVHEVRLRIIRARANPGLELQVHRLRRRRTSARAAARQTSLHFLRRRLRWFQERFARGDLDGSRLPIGKRVRAHVRRFGDEHADAPRGPGFVPNVGAVLAAHAETLPELGAPASGWQTSDTLAT